MKTKILVGAVAALLYGGVALANDKDCPPGFEKRDTQANVDSKAIGTEGQAAIEAAPVDESIVKERVCAPVSSGTGGSGYQSEPLREPQVTPVAPEPAPVVAPPATATPSGAFTPTRERREGRESKAKMRGLTVTAGGGVEGYTGALAPELNPGLAYGVQADIRPSKVFGIELGYTGAVNNLDPKRGVGGASSGPDLVRNGGQAALTFGLGAAPIQPYVLGGIGVSDYNFRGSTAATGLRDDTVGNVPVGAGLRTHVGDFTADLRANYNFLFSQDFAPGVSEGLNENGRYSGTLNIGGTF